jgi:hypothetical protein
MDTRFIYYLAENNKPVYVGKGKELKKRLYHHKWRLKNPNLTIHEIDSIPVGEWKFWEGYWIAQFKGWGFNLLNKNNGGGGVDKHKQSSIESSRKNRTGQKRPTTSVKLKGKPRSEETKNKISKANRGKPKPEGFNERPIIQYTKGGEMVQEWESQSKAAKTLGISQTQINNVLNNKYYYKTAGGCIWKYKI